MKKELDALVSVGLLKTQRMGNQTQFAANEDHPVFAELRALVQKTTGLVPLLQQALAPLAAQRHTLVKRHGHDVVVAQER